MIRFIRLIIIFVLLIVCFSGCSTIGYYHQSISGHLTLISKRERIIDIVNDSAHDEKLIQQLLLSEKLRSFASERLKLPNNDSYRSYVQLDRPYVTWNVFAASEFSVALHQWCFLVVGCVPYRGYFDEAEANSYAEQLAKQGFDVYVAGVPAYSTLGWFDDPLLSSMLDRGEIITASYIFHELAHQQYYLKGDGNFNEAFATAVEEIGVMEWLGDQDRNEDMQRYQDWLQQKSVFSEFIKNSRDEFEVLYQQKYDVEKMQVEKEILISEMRRKFEKLSHNNKHIERYSTWMSGPLNNAQLGAISLYREWVPAFHRIYNLCANDFDVFYRYVEKIAKLSEEQRNETLQMTQACH
jgi:predicted aminopeptidase